MTRAQMICNVLIWSICGLSMIAGGLAWAIDCYRNWRYRRDRFIPDSEIHRERITVDWRDATRDENLPILLRKQAG